MSATIYFRPVGRGADPHLPVDGKSTFLERMEQLFGPSPWLINRENLPVFRGLCVGLGESEALEDVESILEHIEAIEIDFNY